MHKQNILHLNLKKKWFDMIAKGEKEEEYREIKMYWIKRFFKYWGAFTIPNNSVLLKACLGENPFKWMEYLNMRPKYYRGDKIIFTNGYGKNRPKIELWIKEFDIGEGKRIWGAENGKKYFVIRLGGIK